MRNLTFSVFSICFSTFLFSNLSDAQSVSSNEYPIFMANEADIGLIKHSTIKVSDQVSDNCWTNPHTARSKVYLIFEQNAIFVPDYEPAFYNSATAYTYLTSLGFRGPNGVCFTSAEFTVSTNISTILGGAEGKQEFSVPYSARLFERASIFTSSSNSNEQITDFFEGAASEFAAKHLAAKKQENVSAYNSIYSQTEEKPMSQDEFETMISNLSEAKVE